VEESKLWTYSNENEEHMVKWIDFELSDKIDLTKIKPAISKMNRKESSQMVQKSMEYFAQV
jgi:transcription elongation factor